MSGASAGKTAGLGFLTAGSRVSGGNITPTSGVEMAVGPDPHMASPHGLSTWSAHMDQFELPQSMAAGFPEQESQGNKVGGHGAFMS